MIRIFAVEVDGHLEDYNCGVAIPWMNISNVMGIAMVRFQYESFNYAIGIA
jgi:hypothetical protein